MALVVVCSERKKLPVDITYLDFQKAFDKVQHQRLLLKLKAHGIGDGIIDWIEQWLTDRRQCVVVDGEVSNWKSVLSGVPQGSVLRPLLFLIYINDLDDNITSNLLKFADDTKVFRKVNSDGDKQHLQNDLDRLVKWSEKWQMLLNFGKCKCLHTGHGNLDVNYKMGDTVLGTTVWGAVVEWYSVGLFGRRDRGSKPPAAVSKPGQICSPHFARVFRKRH